MRKKNGWDKRKVAFEPSSDKDTGREYFHVGTVTRLDGRKYNMFATFLHRDLARAARAFGRSTLLISSAPARCIRFKFEEQPTLPDAVNQAAPSGPSSAFGLPGGEA